MRCLESNIHICKYVNKSLVGDNASFASYLISFIIRYCKNSPENADYLSRLTPQSLQKAREMEASAALNELIQEGDENMLDSFDDNTKNRTCPNEFRGFSTTGCIGVMGDYCANDDEDLLQNKWTGTAATKDCLRYVQENIGRHLLSLQNHLELESLIHPYSLSFRQDLHFFHQPISHHQVRPD